MFNILRFFIKNFFLFQYIHKNFFYIYCSSITKGPRTNLGCRELISSHFSKILPAISNDINDWIPETRVKAVKLLLELLVNVEVHVVQHLNVTLECLYKASTDPTVSGDVRLLLFDFA